MARNNTTAGTAAAGRRRRGWTGRYGQATSISGSASSTNNASCAALAGPAVPRPTSNPLHTAGPSIIAATARASRYAMPAGTVRRARSKAASTAPPATASEGWMRNPDTPGSVKASRTPTSPSTTSMPVASSAARSRAQDRVQPEEDGQSGEQHGQPVEHGLVTFGELRGGLARADQQRRPPHGVSGGGRGDQEADRGGHRKRHARMCQCTASPKQPHQDGCEK